MLVSTLLLALTGLIHLPPTLAATDPQHPLHHDAAAPLPHRGLLPGAGSSLLSFGLASSATTPSCAPVLQTACDGKCIPSTGDCCATGTGGYCEPGKHCVPGGCCRDGNTCSSGPPQGCSAGRVLCNRLCVPAGAVCCPLAGYCNAGETCAADGSFCTRSSSSSPSTSVKSTISTSSGDKSGSKGGQCVADKVPCANECIPVGKKCCTTFYCNAEETCEPDGKCGPVPGAKGGAGGGGGVGGGVVQCGKGNTLCGTGCMPTGEVCCETYYCFAGQTCAGNGQCRINGTTSAGGATATAPTTSSLPRSTASLPSTTTLGGSSPSPSKIKATAVKTTVVTDDEETATASSTLSPSVPTTTATSAVEATTKVTTAATATTGLATSTTAGSGVGPAGRKLGARCSWRDCSQPSSESIPRPHPLDVAQAQVKPVAGPPPSHRLLVADAVLQGLFNVARPVFDAVLAPFHSLELAVRKLAPPLEDANVLVDRRLDEDLAVKGELVVALELPPELEHADLAPACHPPADDVDLAVLGSPQQRFAGPQYNSVVLGGGVAPPLEHQEVALSAGLLEGGLGEAERQPGTAPPPVEDLDVAVLGCAVQGFGVVALLVAAAEVAALFPVVEDVGAAKVGRCLGGEDFAVKGLEEVGPASTSMSEKRISSLMTRAGSSWKAGGDWSSFLQTEVESQDEPLELVLVDLERVVGVARMQLPGVRHGQVGEDAEGLGEFPVAGVVEDDGPDLGGQVGVDARIARGEVAEVGDDVDVAAQAEQVGLVLDDAQDVVEAVPVDDALGVLVGAVVVPQDGGHGADPRPLCIDLVELPLGDGVLPHVGAHAGDEQNLLGHVPTPEDLEQKGVGDAGHHLGHVVGVDGGQDEQVGPLDELKGLLTVEFNVVDIGLGAGARRP
ncbi:hypothetical protein ColKHC_05260 [Colletotrichum higginsianum]|nr:hypothetical protein ColKHC_05260 [Colletotrichum higginsianum]